MDGVGRQASVVELDGIPLALKGADLVQGARAAASEVGIQLLPVPLQRSWAAAHDLQVQQPFAGEVAETVLPGGYLVGGVAPGALLRPLGARPRAGADTPAPAAGGGERGAEIGPKAPVAMYNGFGFLRKSRGFRSQLGPPLDLDRGLAAPPGSGPYWASIGP